MLEKNSFDVCQSEFAGPGDLFHASLKSSDGGSSYKGHFGETGDERGGKMTAFSYCSPDGDYLLWLEWHRDDTGFEGTGIVDLAVV